MTDPVDAVSLLGLETVKSLGIGETINGVEVISTEPSSVVLSCKGEQRVFKVK